MDPALPCSSRSQRRARFRPDADDHSSGHAEPHWDVSGLHHLWLGGGEIRTQESIYLLPAVRGDPGAELRRCAFAMVHHGAGSHGRILWQWILFRMGLIGSELFPTRIRSRALGFTYNGARTLSALAPYTIGRLAQSRDLSWAFSFVPHRFYSTCFQSMCPEQAWLAGK